MENGYLVFIIIYFVEYFPEEFSATDRLLPLASKCPLCNSLESDQSELLNEF